MMLVIESPGSRQFVSRQKNTTREQRIQILIRIPPAASCMMRTSSSVAPPSAYAVEVFTQLAPVLAIHWQALIFSSCIRLQFFSDHLEFRTENSLVST